MFLRWATAAYNPAFTPRSVIDDWVNIDRYAQTIRPPRGAVTGTGAGFLSAADVTAGRAVFIANNCQGCHGGGKWTVSRRFYAPNDTINNRNPLVTDYPSDSEMASPALQRRE